MKKSIFYFILCTFFLQTYGQVETFSNYPFNGNTYNAIVIKIDVNSIKNFDILENTSKQTHEDFIKSLLSGPAFFLINASISDTSCKPVGYFAKNSQEIQPANLNDGQGNFYLKPNGALLFANDDAIVCESSQITSHQNILLGIQSGPLLLNNGTVNTQFNPNSINKKVRCGVGTCLNSKNEKFVVFCISNNPVSFYELAMLFNKKFKCENALCLESEGCTMYFPGQSNQVKNFEGLICNYIFYKL